MRKVILSILGILIIIGSVLFAKKMISNKKKPRPVKAKVVKTVFTDTVQNTTVQIQIPSNGQLKAKRRIELYAEVQGIFKPNKKLFKTGEKYNKGEAIINIDASEQKSIVKSAKSELYNQLTSIMPDLRIDFPEVYSKWSEYLKNFDFNQNTPELPEFTSDKELYFITGKGIVSSYYNIKNLEQRLSKFTIRAPFYGTLVQAMVTEGTLVRSGQKLGTFIDTSSYEMEVAISKNYAHFLEIHKPVQISNLENTAQYQGIITRINGSINPDTQTIAVFIELSDSKLKEGDYMNAILNVKKEENSIEIDRNLLNKNNEIFIVRNGVLDLLPVTPVFYSDTKVVVKNIPDQTVIVKKQITGGYAGMMVKAFATETSKKK